MGKKITGKKIVIAFALTLISFTLISFTTAWAATEQVLYSFTGGTDGGQPWSVALVFDQAGNLYGTTEGGGLYGAGTVFELSPGPNGWTETVIYNFTGGSDGATPMGGVVFDASGNLYGTAHSNGNGSGTVFELTPSGGIWTLSVLHSFVGYPTDGELPSAGLTLTPAGNLVGVTQFGGKYWGGVCGTVFQLTPSGSSWSYGVFAQFNCANGQWPEDAVIADAYGDVYGTTYQGGRPGYGNVFEAFPGGGIMSFHAFNWKGPNSPDSGVVGCGGGIWPGLCATTSEGGKYYDGAVVKVVPYHGLTVLHAFSGSDGATPCGGLSYDAAGNLYGVTWAGGPSNNGTVFEITPALKKWPFKSLYAFSGADGSEPHTTLVFDNQGNLYGTTYAGGASNQGVVFEITP